MGSLAQIRRQTVKACQIPSTIGLEPGARIQTDTGIDGQGDACQFGSYLRATENELMFCRSL